MLPYYNIIRPPPPTPTKAVESSNNGVVELFLDEAGVELDSKAADGRTLLKLAIEKGRDDVVKVLLGKDGVDVNSKDEKGKNLLSLAAEKGHDMIVKLLLDKGAELESQDNDGQTPLLHAIL